MKRSLFPFIFVLGCFFVVGVGLAVKKSFKRPDPAPIVQNQAPDSEDPKVLLKQLEEARHRYKEIEPAMFKKADVFRFTPDIMKAAKEQNLRLDEFSCEEGKGEWNGFKFYTFSITLTGKENDPKEFLKYLGEYPKTVLVTTSEWKIDEKKKTKTLQASGVIPLYEEMPLPKELTNEEKLKKST